MISADPRFNQIFGPLNSLIDFASIAVWYLERSEGVLVSYYGPLAHTSVLTINFDIDESPILNRAYQERKPVLVEDAFGNTPLAKAFRHSQDDVPGDPFNYVKSVMIFPVRVAADFSIILTLSHLNRGAYSQDDLIKADAYFKSVTPSIETYVLIKILERRTNRIQAFQDIQQAISRHLKIREILSLIANHAKSMIFAHTVFIFLAEGNCLSKFYATDDSTHLHQEFDLLPIEGSLIGKVVKTNQTLRTNLFLSDQEAHPAEAALLTGQSCLLVPLQLQGQPIGVILANGRCFGYFGIEDERTLISLRDSAAVALENAQAYSIEQEKRRNSEVIQTIQAKISPEKPVKEALEGLLAEASHLLRADAAVINIKRADTQETDLTISYSADPELREIIGQTFSLRSCLTDTNKTGVSVPSVASFPTNRLYTISPLPPPDGDETRWLNEIGRKPVDSTPLYDEDALAGKIMTRLCISLALEKNYQGGLFFFWRTPTLLYPENLQQAELICKYIQMVIERNQLELKTQELARVQERQRIAQALHDTVAQFLFRINLEAHWCVDNLSTDPVGKERLQTIQHLGEKCDQELRSAIFALRNNFPGGQNNYVDLLKNQIIEFQNEYQIETTFIVAPEIQPLPFPVVETLYRILRESLTNIRKHANARSVLVSLKDDKDSVIFIIQDDGTGIPQTPSSAGVDSRLHFGVEEIKSMVAVLGGECFIGNNDDNGAMIKVKIPLKEPLP